MCTHLMKCDQIVPTEFGISTSQHKNASSKTRTLIVLKIFGELKDYTKVVAPR